MDIDMKLEVVVIAVADVERATEFYRRLGWRQDVTPPGVVQFTPHGSWCSVQFGATLSDAEPGSAKEYLVVSDLVATRDSHRTRTGRPGTPRTWSPSRSAPSCRADPAGRPPAARMIPVTSGGSDGAGGRGDQQDQGNDRLGVAATR